jgi:long-chain fatty acid transport protein
VTKEDPVPVHNVRRPQPRAALPPLRAASAAAGAAALLVTALGARPALASGFLIYDLSAAALGRASAVTADTNESAAVFFNPAGLSFIGGHGAQAGGVLVTARSTFSPAGGGAETASERGVFFLPTVYAHSTVSDRVTVGMGFFTAFGIGITWPNGWEGRTHAIGASLQTVNLNPTVSFKVDRRVSFAVGFDAVRGTVDFLTGLPALVGGDVRLVGDAWGFGFNFGALCKVVPETLHVGLSYRSRVGLEFAGQADFAPANPDFSRMLVDQPGSATITLPDIITLGVMGRPRSDLALTLDVNLVRWTSYSQIDIAFESAPSRSLQPGGRDTFTVRAGAEYATSLPALRLRGGLIYDRAAVAGQGLGPGLPDGDRADVTAGVGYDLGFIRADVGYMLVYFLPADSVGGREGPEGTYRSLAHLVALTVGASWR